MFLNIDLIRQVFSDNQNLKNASNIEPIKINHNAKLENVLIICQNFHKLLSRKNAFPYTSSFDNAAHVIAIAGQSKIYTVLVR